MSTMQLTPDEDEIFAAVYGGIVQLFDVSIQPNVFKGYQNMTSTPYDSYVVVSPAVKTRTSQGVRSYDPATHNYYETRNTQYTYQIDCYGPDGPDYADIISIAGRSMWLANYFTEHQLPIQILYADDPVQLNLVNAEQQFEQRFMLRLAIQANQTLTLPQDFMTGAPPITIHRPPDCDEHDHGDD